MDVAAEGAPEGPHEPIGEHGDLLGDEAERVVLARRERVEGCGVVTEDELVEEHELTEAFTERREELCAGILLAGDHDRAVVGKERRHGLGQVLRGHLAVEMDTAGQVTPAQMEDLERSEIVGDPPGEPVVFRPGPHAGHGIEHRAPSRSGRVEEVRRVCEGSPGDPDVVPVCSESNESRPAVGELVEPVVWNHIVVAEVDALGERPPLDAVDGCTRALRPFVFGHEVGIELPEFVDARRPPTIRGGRPSARGIADPVVPVHRQSSTAERRDAEAHLDRHATIGQQSDIGLEANDAHGVAPANTEAVSAPVWSITPRSSARRVRPSTRTSQSTGR